MADTRLSPALAVPILIGVGGFVGANLRHGVSLLAPGIGGTLIANAIGSFALAVLLFAVPNLAPIGRRTRLLVGTGLLSSFTTYSTFALETARAGGWLIAGNVVGSYALGFAGVLAGLAIADRTDGGESR